MRTFKSQIDGIIFYPQLVAATFVMLYSLWVGYVVLWILSMLWAVFLIAKIIGTEYVILALSSVGLPLFPSYRGNRNQKHLHETE